MGFFNVFNLFSSPMQDIGHDAQVLVVAGDRSRDHSISDIAEVFVSEVFDVVNEYRQRIGINKLIRLNTIDALCMEHCLYMHKNNDFSHANWDGTRVSRGRKVLELGFTKATENLASGMCYPWQFLDPQERQWIVHEKILGGWLDSPGHKGNIEMRDHTHSGIGVVIQSTQSELSQCFVTQIFAS